MITTNKNMTTTIGLNTPIRFQGRLNDEGISNDQLFQRKASIKVANRHLKDTDRVWKNQKPTHCNHVLPNRSGKCSIPVHKARTKSMNQQQREEADCDVGDDFTATTEPMESSFSSFDNSSSSLSLAEEKIVLCCLHLIENKAETNVDLDASHDDSECSQVEHFDYETVRDKLNNVTEELNRSKGSGKRYQRLVEKQTKYIDAMVEKLGWKEEFMEFDAEYELIVHETGL